MGNDQDLDDSVLHAYVDGMLDRTGVETVIQAMDRDAKIRERVYQLRKSKDLMKVGFSTAQAQNSHELTSHQYKGLSAYVVALLLLTTGFFTGYFSNPWLHEPETGGQVSAVAQKGEKLILHISEPDIEKFSAALRFAEKSLDLNQGKNIQIALITSTEAVNLLRKGKSGQDQRILALLEKYENIYFIACGSAVQGLQARGIKPDFLPRVIQDKPAMEQIIERLQQGWKYRKIESLET